MKFGEKIIKEWDVNRSLVWKLFSLRYQNWKQTRRKNSIFTWHQSLLCNKTCNQTVRGINITVCKYSFHFKIVKENWKNPKAIFINLKRLPSGRLKVSLVMYFLLAFFQRIITGDKKKVCVIQDSAELSLKDQNQFYTTSRKWWWMHVGLWMKWFGIPFLLMAAW